MGGIFLATKKLCHYVRFLSYMPTSKAAAVDEGLLFVQHWSKESDKEKLDTIHFINPQISALTNATCLDFEFDWNYREIFFIRTC